MPAIRQIKLLIRRSRTAMLNYERVNKLGTIIRLILIIVVSMPQGFCCFVRVGESCCPSNTTFGPKKTVSCPCCKPSTPIAGTTDSNGVQREAFPRSCECRCRCQVGMPPSRPNVLDDTLVDRWIEPFQIESLSHAIPIAVSICFSDRVPLQILYCSWQC